MVEHERYQDDRGWFEQLYSSSDDYPHLAGRERQLNLSCSNKGVVRGLHVAPFAKLCACLRGRVYDVVADVRKESPTYKKWFGIWLEEKDRKQLFVPAGCAHGFFSAEDNSLFLYLQDGTYNPKAESQVNWRDPQIGIVWPQAAEYILNERDKNAACLGP